eukprot:TRINITY_DN7988_c0_g4_i1.p3 TRINITY_DN7988_c0_g4~~TRINITY_DN7988_c0_g4_i1.p3  ORF type:complete len:165 (-),score=60.63 TRINITY_DN7988_c0_g4_i1:148-642(-)
MYHPKVVCKVSIGPLKALRVMSIEEWLGYKKEFKEIMRELEELNEPKIECEEEKKTVCLIRIEGLKESVSKEELKVFVSNFARPEYVDYKKGEAKAIVRFKSVGDADKFTQGCNNEAKLKAFDKEGIKLIRLNKDEEADYLLLVEKQRQNFKKYMAARKKKVDE